MNADHRSRFELLSVFGSFAPEDAVALLELGVLPESQCSCPTCQLGGKFSNRVGAADSHGMAVWQGLQSELAPMAVAERLERLEQRFTEAEELLGKARGTLPKGRGSKRNVKKLRATFTELGKRGALEPFGKLKRPA